MPKFKAMSPLPRTITRKILKTGGSDHAFRKLVYDFFTVSSRLEEIRTHIGKRFPVSGPQYTLLIAVAELEGKTGVSVRQVGEYLHVTGTFVAIESGRLAKKGYLIKKASTVDRRVTLLKLTDKAVEALRGIAPELREVNDTMFDLAFRADFLSLCSIMDRLVDNSQRAVDLIRGPSKK